MANGVGTRREGFLSRKILRGRAVGIVDTIRLLETWL